MLKEPHSLKVPWEEKALMDMGFLYHELFLTNSVLGEYDAYIGSGTCEKCRISCRDKMKIPKSFPLLPSSIHKQTMAMERVNSLVCKKPVVIFSTSSCCMCHTVKTLFAELGVNADVHELDEDPQGREMQRALSKMVGQSPALPVVFIGGRMIGSTDRVMSLHLGGQLVELLRDAGALWL